MQPEACCFPHPDYPIGFTLIAWMLIPSLIAGSPSPTCDLGFKSNNCDNAIMGRTIPSYRIASEIEIWRWRPFRKLLDKQDRKIFDEMLSIPRLYNAAGTMVCRPVLIHTILMSIIFEHYKKLSKIVLNNQKTGGMIQK